MKAGSTGATVTEPGVVWRYSIPPNKGGDVLLLTRDNMLVRGRWYGEFGQYFKAWHPIIDRDREKEAALGLL